MRFLPVPIREADPLLLIAAVLYAIGAVTAVWLIAERVVARLRRRR